MKLDLSPTSWGRVIAVTVVGTAFFIAVAFFVDSFNFPYLSPEAVWRAKMTDLLLPLVLGGSFLFFLMWKIRQLAIAQRDLSIIAATDSLTAVLNRGAFSMLVEAYLEQTRKQEQTRSGALLIIDADHFKSINDRLGHDCGDQALKLIAQAIKGQLRGGDIVGRIGGEEFGVFLPGVDP
ncbi:GGDEF domain-containing protein, partial [Mesorhizobium sp. M7A.F.Ca.CA.002.05.1.1]